jgi:hypothetical protein
MPTVDVDPEDVEVGGLPTDDVLKEAEGPLRVLAEALRKRKPLCFTGDVLVAFECDVPDSELWRSQAAMVLDQDDLAAIERLVGKLDA